MGADIGLVNDRAAERRWRVTCRRCGRSVGIVTLRVGSLESWIMSRIVCPSGLHQVTVPGEGLSVERFYEKGGKECS